MSGDKERFFVLVNVFFSIYLPGGVWMKKYQADGDTLILPYRSPDTNDDL